MHSNIKHIGYGAFTSCKSIKNIEIPESVQFIWSAAFEDSNVKRVVMRGRIEKLPARMFNGCAKLREVLLSSTVTKIGCEAFGMCVGLRTVRILRNNREMEVSKTGVILEDNITSIGDGAFMSCGYITKLEIPDSIKYIGKYAFWVCKGLKYIKIPRELRKIEEGAFVNTSIKQLDIPDNIEKIKETAFGDCSTLESVIISNEHINIHRKAFSGCQNLTCITLRNGEYNINIEYIEYGEYEKSKPFS